MSGEIGELKMKFVVSGGGTAGHIYPALAVAHELVAQGHEVIFAGTPQGLEARLVPSTGLRFVSFKAAGFNRKKPYTLVTSTAKIIQSTARAQRFLTDEKVDCVVGFGGYVSIPMGRAAAKQGIPLVLHEQNSYCGMTNKYLARYATVIALTYENAGKQLTTAAPMLVTGNPVRAEILNATRSQGRQVLGISEDALFILVFGGSQGARHINTVIAARAPQLLRDEHVRVFHIAGPKEYETVCAELDALGVDHGDDDRYRVFGYFEHMGDALAACDFTVARAGATSLAEITALGVPALLIPFPYATDDHQTKNAQTLVEAGAAYCIADNKMETPEFSALLLELLGSEALRDRMRRASRLLGSEHAALKVARMAVQAAQHTVDLPVIEALGR
jgi:UDP-N-acetylglucosamine--N-acetylmuramyl-(pentapeptide) pyrophosphoryl-undecaprenol N-acetylglucosamine transferase